MNITKRYSWGDFKGNISPSTETPESYTWSMCIGSEFVEMARGECERPFTAFTESRLWIVRHLGNLRERLNTARGERIPNERPLSQYYELAEELSLFHAVGEKDYPYLIGSNPLKDFQRLFSSEIVDPLEALKVVTDHTNRYLINDFGEQDLSITDDYHIRLASGLPVSWSVLAKGEAVLVSGEAASRDVAITEALNKFGDWIQTHLEHRNGANPSVNSWQDRLGELGRLKQYLGLVKCAIDTHNDDWQQRILSADYDAVIGVSESMLESIDTTSPTAITELRDRLEIVIKEGLEQLTTLAFLEEAS